MDAAAALDLVRRIGICGLAGPDGCYCMSCSVQGVDIDVSCRKSSGASLPFRPDFRGLLVRVHSRHLDSTMADLRPVAREVVRQLVGDDEDSPHAVRLCAQEDDSQQRCVYCHKPREDAAGYFCNEHKHMDAA